jgi:hypothetical protein
LSARLSFRVYNNLIFFVSLLLLIVPGALLLVRIIKGQHRFLKIVYWVITVLLVVLSYKMLIVFNVEIIHFPQYAVLALPVFALLGHFGQTVFWVTLLGTIDEAYQYFVLHPETSVDFNDIVLNLIGAGIGVLSIYTLSASGYESLTFRANPTRKLNHYVTFAIIAFILFGGISLYAADILRLYPDPNTPNALIILRSQPPPAQFWTILDIGKAYHELHATEGIFVSVVLIAFYSCLDRIAPGRRHNAEDFP